MSAAESRRAARLETRAEPELQFSLLQQWTPVYKSVFFSFSRQNCSVPHSRLIVPEIKCNFRQCVASGLQLTDWLPSNLAQLLQLKHLRPAETTNKVEKRLRTATSRMMKPGLSSLATGCCGSGADESAS